MGTEFDSVWHAVGGGALVAAILTIARMLLEHGLRHRDRSLDQAERRGAFERDAEARLERLLQDRLSDSDRRLERCQIDLERCQQELIDERERRVLVERERAVLASQWVMMLQQLHSD